MDSFNNMTDFLPKKEKKKKTECTDLLCDLGWCTKRMPKGVGSRQAP